MVVLVRILIVPRSRNPSGCVNILSILNKYLSHEKEEEMCWTLLPNIGGCGFPPNSNADFTADLLLLGETFTTTKHHKRGSPPQPPTALKVTMEKSTSPRILEVRKIRMELTSAQLCYLIHCVSWKLRKIFLLREKSVDRSWVDGWGGAPSLTIYRNVWNIHNRRILKFTLLQYTFKTTHKG